MKLTFIQRLAFHLYVKLVLGHSVVYPLILTMQMAQDGSVFYDYTIGGTSQIKEVQ